MRPPPTYANVVSTLCLFILLGGGAWAATSFIGGDGKIRGCVSKQGKLTVLQPGKRCRRGQTAIAWNQQGPAGANGQKGDRGESGAKGDRGDPGPLTGPASGDLTGSYPGPTIAPNAVTGGKVNDGSLTGGDLQGDSITGAQLDESTLATVPTANNALKFGGLSPAAYLSSSNVQRIDLNVEQPDPGARSDRVLTSGSFELTQACIREPPGFDHQRINLGARSSASNASIAWQFVHDTVASAGSAQLTGAGSTLFERAATAGSAERGVGTFVYRDDLQTVTIPFEYFVSWDEARCVLLGTSTRLGG